VKIEKLTQKVISEAAASAHSIDFFNSPMISFSTVKNFQITASVTFISDLFYGKSPLNRRPYRCSPFMFLLVFAATASPVSFYSCKYKSPGSASISSGYDPSADAWVQFDDSYPSIGWGKVYI
jgi:hypothetical protein